MPEIRDASLDVSAEEERYLRRTFHRFALPYLAAILVVVALMVAAGGMVTATQGDGGGDEMNSLVAEAASLRDALAAVREELQARDADAAERIEAVEGRLTQLRARVGAEPTEELASRLDHAHQRINALEGRLAELESRRAAAPEAPAPRPSPAASAWPRSGTDRP